MRSQIPGDADAHAYKGIAVFMHTCEECFAIALLFSLHFLSRVIFRNENTRRPRGAAVPPLRGRRCCHADGFGFTVQSKGRSSPTGPTAAVLRPASHDHKPTNTTHRMFLIPRCHAATTEARRKATAGLSMMCRDIRTAQGQNVREKIYRII